MGLGQTHVLVKNSSEITATKQLICFLNLFGTQEYKIYYLAIQATGDRSTWFCTDLPKWF